MTLWRFDEKTMEFSEFAIMPRDLLYSLFDSDVDDKFASLKCVGLADLIYAFNEDYHKRYPTCVCEITTTTTQQSGGGKCKWRRVPSCNMSPTITQKALGLAGTLIPTHFSTRIWRPATSFDVRRLKS